MNYARLAAEFLRALRGKRTQKAACRKLGARSNVVHQWERGNSFPSASKTLWVASKLGVDVPSALAEFYRVPPAWLSSTDPFTAEGIAVLLDDLRGGTSIVELSRYSGKSRFAIARWLSGTSEPRLPDFLLMVERSSLRLLDFIEAFVDPRALPSAVEPWRKLQVARRLAYDEPWSQAVLRALELRSYSALVAHRPGWIAEQIGIEPSTEERCLKLLQDSGQISFDGSHYRQESVTALDTRRDPDAARKLRVWWLRQAAARIDAGERGMMYNLFGVSTADLAHLRDLQRSYLTELRSIVARSEPVEHVVLAADLLLELR
ncbi:MAG TPA: DUF4423 domain-containing protein [Polyangiaceae bacterium]|nr:DUF4423 domain-containing protein [Polyangiaceae bacterium]